MGKWRCVGPEGCSASQGSAGEAVFALVDSSSWSGCTTSGQANVGPPITWLQHVFPSHHGAVIAAGGCLVTADCNAIPYLFDLMVQSL